MDQVYFGSSVFPDNTCRVLLRSGQKHAVWEVSSMTVNNYDLPGLHPIIFHIAHLFPFKPAFIVFNPCIDWGSKNSIFAHFTLISCYDIGKNQWFKNCWVVSLSHKHVCISFSICTVLSTVERLWVFALSCLLFRNCWVVFFGPTNWQAHPSQRSLQLLCISFSLICFICRFCTVLSTVEMLCVCSFTYLVSHHDELQCWHSGRQWFDMTEW